MHLLRAQSECHALSLCGRGARGITSNVDTRDKEAILRVCTAYLKLFFHMPCVQKWWIAASFSAIVYGPAVQMRTIIRKQLQILDPKEFGGKNVAAFTLKEKSIQFNGKSDLLKENSVL
jgi:ATP-dependent Lon protease